jgi:hydrogenase maturation protease
MSAARILIACVGNIFLGDDAFGVEVAKRLALRSWPTAVRIIDFGIRGLDLTYALLEDYQLIIIVDAVQRGGNVGDLYLIEPLLENAGAMETHEMAPAKALAAARTMGAKLTNVVIVGCETVILSYDSMQSFDSEDEPQMELCPAVAAAVDEAVAMIESIVAKTLEAAHA